MARQPDRLAIVAGGGSLPARIAAAARSAGREFFVLALEGQADPAFVERLPHRWMRLGAVGTGFEILKEEGAAEIVFAGQVRRPNLTALRPDRKAIALSTRLAKGFAAGDDSVFQVLVSALEDEGFRVVGAESLLDGVLAVEGPYGAHRPDARASEDIVRGIVAARAAGAVDSGQAVVVRDGEVIGVEGEDGTDALIARCAAAEGRGGVLVKVAKPGQERRVDLPTIGPQTVDNAAAARLSGIAVEAGGALVLDRAEVARRADAAGLFVVGVAVTA
jgi:DUF1009 family protein